VSVMDTHPLYPFYLIPKCLIPMNLKLLQKPEVVSPEITDVFDAVA